MDIAISVSSLHYKKHKNPNFAQTMCPIAFPMQTLLCSFSAKKNNRIQRI